jgi:hypothetical protein
MKPTEKVNFSIPGREMIVDQASFALLVSYDQLDLANDKDAWD